MTTIQRFSRVTVALLAAISLLLPAVTLAQTPSPVAELYPAPESLRLTVGGTQTVSVSMFDKAGNPLTEIKVNWSVEDPKVASITQQGVVKAVKAGETHLIARAGGKVVTIPVTVRAAAATAPVAEPEGTLAVLPNVIELIPGERRPVTAFQQRPTGNVVATGVVWRATQPWAATVDANGMVTGVARGSGQILATLGEATGTAQARVVDADVAVRPTSFEFAVGERDSVRAFVPAQSDRALGGGFAWRAADPTVLKVSANGDLEGVSPGVTEAVLEGPGVFVRVPVRIIPAASHFEVSPPPSAGVVRLPQRGDRRFTARPLGTDGEVLRNATIQWIIADTGVISFDPANGRLVGKRVGNTTLTASSRGLQQAVWQIEVVPADIALSPQRMGLRAGESARVVGRAISEKGDSLGQPDSLRWTTDRVDVASVAVDGVVSGQAFGVATITATTPAFKTASTKVFVTGDFVMVTNRSGTPPSAMQALLTDPDKMTLLMQHGVIHQAVLSPDRTRIAYAATVDSSMDLYVADADGRNARRLTSDPGAERDPVWLPDGSGVVYTAENPLKSGVEARSQIMLAPLDGAPRGITSGIGASSMPTVSPDGKRVAFTTVTEGRGDVYEVGLENTTLRRHTFTQEKERAPLFLRNGDLLYATEKGGSSQILRIPAGTDKPISFGKVNQSVIAMAASRDGKTVAILSGKLDNNRARGPFTVTLHNAETGLPTKTLVLRPNEVVTSVSF